MDQSVLTLDAIKTIVKPLAEKYQVREIDLFGSYARGEATGESDLDFLAFGGENFEPTNIFALAEELFERLKKNVDVYEIREVNRESEFYRTIMRERLQVA